MVLRERGDVYGPTLGAIAARSRIPGRVSSGRSSSVLRSPLARLAVYAPVPAWSVMPYPHPPRQRSCHGGCYPAPYSTSRVMNQAGRRAPRSSPHPPVHNSAAKADEGLLVMASSCGEHVGFGRTRTAPLRIAGSCPRDGFGANFERERCAEVQQRILQMKTCERTHYTVFAGPRPACSPVSHTLKVRR
jgi:hypothetical protein